MRTNNHCWKHYMGKNTMERQKFIIDNLRIEDDSEMDKM